MYKILEKLSQLKQTMTKEYEHTLINSFCQNFGFNLGFQCIYSLWLWLFILLQVYKYWHEGNRRMFIDETQGLIMSCVSSEHTHTHTHTYIYNISRKESQVFLFISLKIETIFYMCYAFLY